MIPPRGGVLERVSREEWNVGIIRQTASDIVQRGIVKSVEWLEPLHPWYGLANPACYVHPDESRTVFAARPNYLSGRGEIWRARLSDSSMISGFERWAKADIDLSGPFPIPEEQGCCFTMETSEIGKLYLWWKTKLGWSRSMILDRPAVDPTIWRASDRWWLFCTFMDSAPDQDLHLFHAEQLRGPWIPHPMNPVKKSDLASARPAGPLFRADDGRLIRPSQDSTQSYGSAVVLNVIVELTPVSFREQPLRRLLPQSEYPDGLHTICPAGDVTLIDGKRWGINVLDPPRYVVVGLGKRLRRWQRKDGTVQFASAT